MRFIAAAMSLVVLTTALPSLAQDKEACVSSSESAQKLRSQKKLRAARKALVSCAQESCPSIVKKDCVSWLQEVDDSIPTVTLSARDASGTDLADVKVLIDGDLLTEKLDGSALAVDPGLHTFRFEPSKGDAVETKVLVREAEKNRVVSVTIGSQPVEVTAKPIATTPVTADTPPSRGLPTGTYVFGAIAAVSFVGFAYFGLSGRAARDDLKDRCAPYCNKDDEQPARTKLAVADISLGVGIVSLGVATVLALMPHGEKKTAAIRVDAVPIAGGAVGMLGGSF